MSPRLWIHVLALCGLSLAAEASSAQDRAPRERGARGPDTTEVYKTIGDTKLNIEIYLPPGHQAADQRPAIVFFFGGGWSNGTTKQFAHHCSYLASRGMVALAADYRVYNRQQARVIDCIADAKSAIRWTRANAARLGIDPERIAAGGGSAGGHLAAAVGILEGFEDPADDKSVSAKPSALALFNPALDLTAAGFQARPQDERYSAMAARIGTKAEDVSPSLHIQSGAPPAIVFHGEADVTVPYAQAKAFAEGMKAAGNRCELVGYPGKAHGFFNFGRDDDSFAGTVRRLDIFLAGMGYLKGEPQVEQYISGITATPAAKSAP